jgi:uncharacterized membrane protein (UPF0182 family)
MSETIDWQPRRPPPRRRRGRLFAVAVLGVLLLGGGTALSYYVDALWFESLGFAEVFWKTLRLQSQTFTFTFAATFAVLYGAFLALKPSRLGELSGIPLLINGQPIQLPVEPVLRLVGIGGALFLSLATAASITQEWMTLALWWSGAANSPASSADPIFGRSVGFYLFTLPAYQLFSGWAMTVAVVVTVVAGFFALVVSGTRALARGGADRTGPALRRLSIAFAGLLLVVAWRVYLGRFDRLFADHTIFSGVTYTEAHVTLTGLLVVSGALVLGAVLSLVNAVAAPRVRWLVAAVVPAALCAAVVAVLGWYTSVFLVKPNELVRERPYIAHNIEMTRRAFDLERITQRPFPASSGIEALDPAANGETLRNIRLWDWRALQDTLRQIQEIRTYYDFPDIDIDRYEIDGATRQMMLGTRELSIEKLPESSRNWINEKLIYTHGYGVTMNPVNGFTGEGMPDLVLKDMPVQSRIPSLKVTRPQIYFGELTNGDAYVKTRQKEFDYPQGEAANLTSYEGSGGIVIGGFLRRALIALDRGDLAKLPFSDDVTAESRLLMRRNIRERVDALTPFITYDDDPYIVVTDEGRLVWMLDGYTTSDSYPYARHTRLGRARLNYLRNSVKAVVDAYDGTVDFYVFDAQDPIVNGYRAIFPSLFKDGAAMPATLRRHVRYPELMLQMQASVYALYHMTNPDAFYNREDLWTIASEVGITDRREQATWPMEPNYVLMKLPGEEGNRLEFVEILPFTPANRNNLIGWIAGRSDGEHYGNAVVYDFPKTRLVDGPLQIEARIDQNAQLSSQLSLWNQQGSRVLRGALIVIPVGSALLYAEPIYLQAERSPMPELRIVVLAMQDRLAYGPTFEAALAALFGEAAPSLNPAPAGAPAAVTAPGASGGRTPAPAAPVADASALIAQAAKDLADYQRLTAEGKLGEAGARLEAVKRALDALQRR